MPDIWKKVGIGPPLTTERIFTMRTPHTLSRFVILGLFFLGLLGPFLGHAAQVDETVSRQVAHTFMAARSGPFAGLRAEDLVLVRSVGSTSTLTGPAAVYFRIYNAGTDGFVIVAGDDAITPVLGYSTEGAITGEEVPYSVAKWFDFYKGQISEHLNAGAEIYPQVAEAWSRLLSGDAQAGGDRAVNPLCQTTWDQPAPYNAQCPGGSLTGCVATAMAQVMKYHNHPAQGQGFHSYAAPNYGTLSANFGSTTYDWGSMPNNVTSANSAVATLMYHCGVGVDMQYSPNLSGAWVLQSHSPSTDHNTEYAMKTYFGYGTDMQGVYRDQNSLQNWNNMLKAELDASRPIIYAGFGQGGGHCFVCDGYDNNSFFHFNWGWSGAYDGFFAMDALNPTGQGSGGGSGAYNSGQEALINIHPATGGGGGGGNPAALVLYNYVTPSATTIGFAQPFTVSTNILNNGTTDFNGDYAVAAFDASSNFYGFVQTYTGQQLQAGYVYNQDIVFSTNGLVTMVPGTYYLGVLFRPTGGEWTAVGNNSGYTNFTQVTVVYSNDIEVYAAITPSPGNSVAQGTQLSVNLNIANAGANTFIGQYGVALYDLEGNWVQDIGTIDETQGLPSGYAYNPPYLTFGPATVTVPPGTYLLACQHNPNNSGWQLSGASYFQNPIFITVTGASIQPDPYEVNNTAATAYSLPVNFSGNTASTGTPGSNLHVNTDMDFYKVNLAGGYDYTITARLHDSYNSGNGNTYTMDGVFSVSDNGTDWSQAVDDVMAGDILFQGGGTLYFQVAPYFAGQVGTYLLSMDIQRAPSTGIAAPDLLTGISAWPNPARDRLTIDMHGIPTDRAELRDAQGRLVATLFSGTSITGTYTADISGVTTGTYMLRLSTEKGMHTERIIVAR